MTLRVLVAVTHLLGVGHLARGAALARALAARGHETTLVSGGAPAALIDVAGCRFVQLAPVRSAVGDFVSLLDADSRSIGPGHLDGRRRRLIEAFEESRPDVVVTELFPFGRRMLAAEFTALLDAADSAHPRPLVLASIRDILVAPARPAKIAAAHDMIARRYDAVLVHGDDALLALDASWPVDAGLRSRLHYTGYVDAGDTGVRARAAARGDVTLVSGGSSAAALPLYRAALAAAVADQSRHWRILVGAGVDPRDRDTLARDAPANVSVENARPDFRDLMSRAAVFVGQAGYNTIVDVVASEVRAVLVPFEQGRETEQRLRARMMEERGLATLLPERDLSAETLTRAIAAEMTRPRRAIDIRLDGARCAVSIIEGLAASRVGPGLPLAGAAA